MKNLFLIVLTVLVSQTALATEKPAEEGSLEPLKVLDYKSSAMFPLNEWTLTVEVPCGRKVAGTLAEVISDSTVVLGVFSKRLPPNAVTCLAMPTKKVVRLKTFAQPLVSNVVVLGYEKVSEKVPVYTCTLVKGPVGYSKTLRVFRDENFDYSITVTGRPVTPHASEELLASFDVENFDVTMYRLYLVNKDEDFKLSINTDSEDSRGEVESKVMNGTLNCHKL